MRKLGRAARVFSLGFVFVALAAGCGGGGSNQERANANGATGGGSASKTEQQLCGALDDLSTSLKQLQHLDPATASSAEIEAKAADAQKAARTAVSAAADQSKTDVESIEEATADLKAAVKSVPSGTSAKQELKEVHSQLDKTAELVQSTINGLACSTTSD
jgi:hypothetical protein